MAKEINNHDSRSIDWATRHHKTSMVQTVHRSRQPSDGKVCGMRASRKTLCSQRSLTARPGGGRFTTEAYGDDRPFLRDGQYRADTRRFMSRLKIAGQ